MKNLALLIILFSSHLSTTAQNFKGFDVFLKIKTSPLKDQQSSGTCWSFATTSFIETEALRLGKESISLSPIFYVHPTYINKAGKYIETKGTSYFDAGDLTFSVLDAYKKYGAVPESVYTGILAEDWQHDHLEMDNLLYSMVESIGTSGYGRIKPESWKKSIDGVLKAYLGSPPTKFEFNNEVHSPQSFAHKYVGINPDDYIEITSYSNSSYYDMFILDIPANWNNRQYLNLPIDDFEKVIDYALHNGFSLAWDGDASEPEFDFNLGIAKLTPSEESGTITQELRQSTFEDKSTTDDHNMHIIGKARDEHNEIYYLLKNSEGTNAMNGYIFMSRKAILLKTISLLVHVDALPPEIQKHCNLKEIR